MVERPSHISIPLSNLSGGVNRFVQEIGPNQCADALNVVNDEGEVRRRDAFVPVGSGPPHIMPAGFCRVVTADTANATQTDRPTRAMNMNGVGYVYVGARFSGASPVGQFDGVAWPRRSVANNSLPSAHVVIQPQYWNGTAWTDVPGFIDETREYRGTYFVTLFQEGHIYWHTRQFATLWTTTAILGVTTFWIRLRLTNLVTGLVTSYSGAFGSNFTLGQPGIRLFHHGPVRGIFPFRIENRSGLVLASDRLNRHHLNTSILAGEGSTLGGGVERGAQIGTKFENISATRPAIILEDEGSGTYGQLTWPQPRRNDNTNIGSAPGQYGTASRMQKVKTQLFNPDNNRFEPYLWWDNQFRGGRLTNALVPAAAFDVATVRTATALPVTEDGYYRHCRIVSTAQVGGLGTPLDEEREIWDYDNGSPSVLSVHPDWSVAPDANNRFILYAPHAECELDNGPDSAAAITVGRVWPPRLEIRANQEHTLEFQNAGYTNPLPTNASIQYFKLGREARFMVDAAPFWSGVVDKVTGRAIVTNGNSGLLEFDGRYMRRLKADFRSDVALGEVGQLPDTGPPDGENRALALSLLRRNPPDGKYIVQHHGRLFVAGFKDDPFRLKWSSYGGANNVWPLINEGMVRDEEQDPITGMATLDDRLIVFTPTALHEAVPIDQAPFFDFTPLSRGIGFVGHQAVAVISGTTQASRLVGIAPDGLYAYSSGEPTIVLDDWKRLLENGVNQDMLEHAVAVGAPQKSWALFAVPAKGSSENNRIIVWDYFRDHFWVWSAPRAVAASTTSGERTIGISSLAVDYDEAGKERILFGTNDGYVMTLGDDVDDDGMSINAFALSAPVTPFGGRESKLVGLELNAITLGPSTAQQMECDILTGDDADTPLQEGVLTIDKGDTAYNTANWNAFRWQKHGYRTVRMNIVSYARAHRIAYRVGGAVKWALRSAELICRAESRRGAAR